MRLFLLSLLAIVGITACGTLVKESGSGVISSVVNDLDEADLSDSVDEALAVGHQNGTSAFTYVGLGLFAIGAVVFAFVSTQSGLKLIGCGSIAGAVPYIVQSAYFSIVISGALLLALLIAIYHLWWKVKKIETTDDGQEKP